MQEIKLNAQRNLEIKLNAQRNLLSIFKRRGQLPRLWVDTLPVLT